MGQLNFQEIQSTRNVLDSNQSPGQKVPKEASKNWGKEENEEEESYNIQTQGKLVKKNTTQQTEANSTALFSQFELSNQEEIEVEEASDQDSSTGLDIQETAILGEDEANVMEDCQLKVDGKLLWIKSSPTAKNVKHKHPQRDKATDQNELSRINHLNIKAEREI